MPERLHMARDMSLMGTYILTQHDLYAIPSEMILWHIYSASFKNQIETLIDLLH